MHVRVTTKGQEVIVLQVGISEQIHVAQKFTTERFGPEGLLQLLDDELQRGVA